MSTWSGPARELLKRNGGTHSSGASLRSYPPQGECRRLCRGLQEPDVLRRVIRAIVRVVDESERSVNQLFAIDVVKRRHVNGIEHAAKLRKVACGVHPDSAS